jgi:hypothetical protein
VICCDVLHYSQKATPALVLECYESILSSMHLLIGTPYYKLECRDWFMSMLYVYAYQIQLQIWMSSKSDIEAYALTSTYIVLLELEVIQKWATWFLRMEKLESIIGYSGKHSIINQLQISKIPILLIWGLSKFLYLAIC